MRQKALLVRINRNQSVDGLRAEIKGRAANCGPEDCDECVVQDSSHEVFDEMRPLFEITAQLSPALRKPVLMRYSGYTKEEIAGKLGISLRALDKRLERAKKRIVNSL